MHTKIAEVRVNKAAANIICIVLTTVLSIAGVGISVVLPHHIQFAEWHVWALFGCFVVLLPVHEALHALGLIAFAGVRWENIRFGVMWDALMPYCQCLVPISVRAYRRMVLLPLLVTGSISIAALLAFPAIWLGAFAGVAVAACVGDVWIVIKLRSFEDTHLALDSSTEIGCDILSADAGKPS